MSTAAPPVDPDPVALRDAEPGAAPTAPAAGLRCDNCGAAVTEKYCGACGQRLEPPVHSLWHFTQVAVEDLTHADSRLWRTLAALLFQPGFLTREFLSGRRASYLPPVRLYLVLSLLFFLWTSATHARGDVKVLTIGLPDRGVPSAAWTPIESANGSPLCARGETAERCAQRVCDNSAYRGPGRHFVVTTLHQACLRAVANSHPVDQAIVHNLPRAMFLFLPLLAAVMMLMYWWPRHYYVEHLLLFVHFHAFVFLLLLLAGLASALLPPVSVWVDLAVALYVAWYAYRSMRVVYGQSRWLTLGKLVVLSFFYLLAGSLTYAFTSIYSALTT